MLPTGFFIDFNLYESNYAKDKKLQMTMSI